MLISSEISLCDYVYDDGSFSWHWGWEISLSLCPLGIVNFPLAKDGHSTVFFFFLPKMGFRLGRNASSNS